MGVRSVQNLSACKKVPFTFTFKLKSIFARPPCCYEALYKNIILVEVTYFTKLF